MLSAEPTATLTVPDVLDQLAAVTPRPSHHRVSAAELAALPADPRAVPLRRVTAAALTPASRCGGPDVHCGSGQKLHGGRPGAGSVSV
jgi:hypothetical protein